MKMKIFEISAKQKAKLEAIYSHVKLPNKMQIKRKI